MDTFMCSLTFEVCLGETRSREPARKRDMEPPSGSLGWLNRLILSRIERVVRSRN